MNINMDIYKSKNDYMVKKIYDGIFGKEDVAEDDDRCKRELACWH